MEQLWTKLRPFFLPPTLEIEWDHLRREANQKPFLKSLVVLIIAAIVTIPLDFDLIPHLDVFYMALAIRFGLIVPIFSIYIAIGLKIPRFMVKHQPKIVFVLIVLVYTGFLALNTLRQTTKPTLSPDFAPSRLLVIWVFLVVLPVRIPQPIMLVIICLATYLALTLIFTVTDPFWIGMNIMSLIAVCFFGLFANYNQEVTEYRFYRALSQGVTQLYSEMGSMSERAPSLLINPQMMLRNSPSKSTRAVSSVRAPRFRPVHDNINVTAPPLVLKSLDNRLKEVMLNVDPADISYEMEGKRIVVLEKGFSESINTSLFGLVMRFYDIYTEKAFQQDYSSRYCVLRQTRVSILIATLAMCGMGAIEYAILNEEGVDEWRTTLLLIFRFCLAIPMMFVIEFWTFCPQRHVSRLHQVVTSVALIFVQAFQITRYAIIMPYFAENYGVDSTLFIVQHSSFACSVLRGLAYLICGLPLLSQYAICTALISIVGAAVFILLLCRGIEGYSMSLVYPLIVLAFGGYRSLVSERKARMVFLLRELADYKLKEEAKMAARL